MPAPTDTLYNTQWHLFGTWGVNAQVVWDGAGGAAYTGEGVSVAVFDSGVDRLHSDLAVNYDLAHSISTNAGGGDGTPGGTAFADFHGTAVAGLIAAARNGTGVVGVAYDSSIISIYQQFGGSNGPPGVDNIQAFNHAAQYADIMNNSWGYSGIAFFLNIDPAAMAPDIAAVRDAAEDGRGGLGTIMLHAAGNSRASGADTNDTGFGNNRWEVVVGATDINGNIASFSTPGASILVSAPGVGLPTTDRTGAIGYSSDDFDMAFGGTSAATPVASGVVALMLEARAGLGWRDVQDILALSARQTGVTAGYQYNGASNWNGGGTHWSHDFGAGLIDARAAVRLAETWILPAATSANEVVLESAVTASGAAITDGNTVNSNIVWSTAMDIEHVEVDINLTHTFRGDLEIRLTSPSGVTVLLADNPLGGQDATDNISFTLSSTFFRGESGVGTWTLSITDNQGGDVGVFTNWQLRITGDLATTSDVYYYNDEFNEMFARDPAHAAQRGTLNDTDGGTDVVNASMLSTAAIIDLGGGASSIDGHALAIVSGVIENAYGGDGGDTLRGSGSVNVLYGQRGNDLIEGMSGNDELHGHWGIDSLYGGLDDDTLFGETEVDYLYGGDGNDLMFGGTGIDTLNGGYGDDFYRLDDADIVDENSPGTAGLDTVWVSFTNYTLTSGTEVGAVNFAGAAILTGEGDRNTLFGDLSADTLFGLGGSDYLYGFASGDSLYGGAGDDFLFGGTGGDTLVGGADNDYYRLDDGGADTVIEGAGGGTGSADQVWVGFSGHTLAANVEWGVLNFDTAGDLTGNASDNTLYGTDGVNTLSGADGNDNLLGYAGVDVLYGGNGNDVLQGGLDTDTLYGGDGNDAFIGGTGAGNTYFGGVGDDFYRVDAGADVVDETGGSGIDTVWVSVTIDYVAPAGIENLAANIGTALNLTGNTLDNFIQGNDAVNTLSGAAGNDTLQGFGGADRLVGGTGRDVLSGGTGADIFAYSAGDGNDVIVDFNFGDGDRIDLTGIVYIGNGATADVALLSADGGVTTFTISANNGYNWTGAEFI
ncbi:MAG: S8 family serine peptidase [Rhodospirillales bacterium]|nr:MAG: S8 family serine peptidase [Rhodospirillales bacterium]